MLKKHLALCMAAAVFLAGPVFADAPAEKAKASTHASAKAPVKSAPKESIKKGVSIDQLEGPRLAAAIGHFSRARKLLIDAVYEFDAGLKIGNPDILINSDAWRRAVIEQASELDRVLSPQPAAPQGGIKYPGDSRLLSESKP